MATKAELIADLESRVIKIDKAHPVQTLQDGSKEYSFETKIYNEGIFQETYTIRVIDEGTENEFAGYVSGKRPPLSLGKKLAMLKTEGAVKFLDISKLGIPYAKVKINDQVKFIAEIDGQMVIEDGE